MKRSLDVRGQLPGISLANLPHALLPKKEAADKVSVWHAARWRSSRSTGLQVATMKGALQEKGAQTPFVMVDLKDFVPHWAHGQNKEAEPSKHLRLAQWGPAFDRAAIALACNGQWELASAMAHKDNCLQVCMACNPAVRPCICLCVVAGDGQRVPLDSSAPPLAGDHL